MSPSLGSRRSARTPHSSPGVPRLPETFAKEKVFLVAWDVVASQQVRVSTHVRERDKGLLRGILSGEYGMDFNLDRSEGTRSLPVLWWA